MNTAKEKSEFELILDLLKNWIKHWYYFAISLFICGLIGGIFYKLKTPEYEIQATVALRTEDNNGGFTGMSAMKSLGFAKSTPGNNVEDEALIMASHGPIKKMIRNLNLNTDYTLSKFWGIKKMSLYDKTPVALKFPENFTDTLNAVIFADMSMNNERTTVKMKINKDKVGKFKFDKLPASIATPYGTFVVEKTQYFNDYGKSFDLSAIIYNDDLQSEIYGGKLKVKEERKTSDIIHLSINDDNVFRGREILKGIIRVHNEGHAKEKSLVGEQTLEFLNTRLAEVNTDLKEVDAKIQVFKEKYGLTDIEADAKGFVDQGSELMPLLVESQSQLEIIKLTDKYLNDPKNEYEQIPYIIVANGSEELLKAVSVYNEELAKRSESLLSEKKKTPVTKNFDSQLKSLRENLVSALKNTRKGVEVVADNLKKKESELIGKMKDYPVMEKSFLELKREQELKQALFIFLQQKKEDALVTSVTVNSKLRVIDEPYPLSKPTSPNLLKIMLVVVFFGGIVLPLSMISLEPYILARRKKKNE